MNTAVRQDFKEFIEFVKYFSLEEVIADPKKLAAIRLAHAQFLALLTVASELCAAQGSGVVEFNKSYGNDGRKYFGEVVSDFSEFMMCLVMGLHRSAGGTLRSAIESYLKAFSLNDEPQILKRTSVPEVFSDAAAVSFFSTSAGKSVVAGLKSAYSELNMFVHTVSPNHMFGALAVGAFPRWSENSERLITIFIRVARLFLYAFVGSRRDLFDSFDHRNKIVVNRAMTRDQRRSALGVDG